jgi:hypothetical protein
MMAPYIRFLDVADAITETSSMCIADRTLHAISFKGILTVREDIRPAGGSATMAAQAQRSAGRLAARKASLRGSASPGLAGEEAIRDDWFSGSADPAGIAQMGIKRHGGGPHQSKTMMFAELTTLLASGAADHPVEAILRQNLLGKPSVRAREAALFRLRQLYGIGEDCPIGLVMQRLWDRDPAGRPSLALLCALARDPTLRGGAAAVLDASLGEPVRWTVIAATFEARHPGRLSEKMGKSLAQNAASTWTQAGFLKGAVRKERVRAVATPATAAYAALLAGLCGFGGMRLVESRWLNVLDRPLEDRMALLRQAEGTGLARIRSVGDVLEVDARGPLQRKLGVPSLVEP